MLITRDEYNKLRKMDHKNFSDYIENKYYNPKVKSKNKEKQLTQDDLDNSYNEGFNAGVTAMSSKVVDCIDDGIRNTKGIGKKLYESLMNNITAKMIGG